MQARSAAVRRQRGPRWSPIMSHNGVEAIDSDSTSSSLPTSGSAISIPNSKAARRGATILRFRAISHRSVLRDHRITWARDAGNAITPTS